MDINVVAENLAELLTNSVNLTDVYYDLFINPEPMDITLQMYNSQNQLVTVTIPNRAKDKNNVGNLDISNFNPESISYYSQNNLYPQQFPNNVKVATDLSVNMSIPVIGESFQGDKIHDTDQAEDFYNIPFQIRDGIAIFNFSNAVCTPWIVTPLYGAYSFTINSYVFCPNFTVSRIATKKDVYSPTLGSTFSMVTESKKEHSFMFPMKMYTILKTDVNYTFGIVDSIYRDPDSKTTRNYSYLKTASEPRPFIPVTMYGIDITGYNENNEVTSFYTDAVTMVQGTEGSSFEGNQVFQVWHECSHLQNIHDFIWGAPSTTEVTYNGKSYECWQALGCGGSEYWSLATADNKDTEAEYKEVRLPYERNEIFQEVIDSNNNVGYCQSFWYDLSNNESGYEKQPDSEVDENETIFKSLIPSNNPETWENTGDFKYTFRMFQASNPYNTNKVAYKVYQLVDGNNSIQWTTEPGEENDAFYGMSANNPNEAQWAYNEQPKWYEVDQSGTTYYVTGGDLVEYGGITLPPTIGAYVPENIRLFQYPDRNSYVKDSGNQDTIFSKDTPEVIYTYSGETSFVYNGQEDTDAEQYFSESDWGIFKNNHDDTYTKIPEAYYWQCVSAYKSPGIDLQRFYPSCGISRFDASNGDFIGGWLADIDYGYWWVLRAWEVEDQNGVKGWFPIPPNNSDPSESTYTQYANQEVSNRDFYPMNADGSRMSITELEYPLKYTGNYNADFLGRYTKYQNGEL